MDSQRVKLIAIVGPTASGKTQLAIDVAKKFDGDLNAGPVQLGFGDAE